MNTNHPLHKRLYWKHHERLLGWAKLPGDLLIQIKVLGAFFLTKAPPAKPKKSPRLNSLLVVSYYSPPYPSFRGTQRLAKFIKYWSALGCNITLLSTIPNKEETQDKTNEALIDRAKVVRIGQNKIESPLKNKHFLVPDNFLRWIHPARKQAMQIISDEPVDAVFATVPPYSNAIAASLIAKDHDLPLIVDFRDPWTKIDVAWVIKNNTMKKINEKMENRIIKQSNAVMMADDKSFASDFFVKSDTALDKIISITNGYDEDDFKHLPDTPLKTDKFDISYIGSIYSDETFNNLIEPLLEWSRLYPEDMAKVRLIYAGASSYFAKLKNTPFEIITKGFVEHPEAIKIRYQSNLQLFSQPLNFKDHVYSGKIFEMIRTPVPILAITKVTAASAALVTRTRTGAVVAPGNISEAVSFLKGTFEEWENDHCLYAPNKDIISNYSRRHLAEKAFYKLHDLLSLSAK